MRLHRSFFVLTIFVIPLLLGIAVVGYWYWTTRVEQKTLLPVFGSVPQFSLTTEDNRSFTDKELRGKISVIDFIFTECAGACPMMSGKMQEMQQHFAENPHIQFVSFSVDPETDTPSVLREYGQRFNSIHDKWTFLTGDKQQIYRLTKEGFHLGLDIEGDNAIIHSQKFVLVDHNGVIRGYYDSEDDEAMNSLLRDATILSRKF
jgi:protein SCO1